MSLPADLFRTPARYMPSDVQIVPVPACGGEPSMVEVWDADEHLFNLPNNHPDVLACALSAYNAGRATGTIYGRGEVQSLLRQILGAAAAPQKVEG